MKTTKLLISLLALFSILLLAACGGSDEPAESAAAPVSAPAAVAAPAQDNAPAQAAAPAEAAPAAAAPAELNEEYENALTIKNQLILGSIWMEGTPDAITPEQAKTLLPYWQLYRSLTASETAATEETTAVQNQILALMTPDQIQAIAAMQITNIDMQAYYVEIGAKEAKDDTATPEAGATGVPMRDLSPEAKATAKAERGIVSSSSGLGTILADNLITLLEGK